LGSWVWSIFPPHGLDQTIHVSILLGVLFLLFLTEAFGWVYSGLVVPGYLASVLVFQPAAGLAILAEAILTFLLARFLSDVVSRSGAWSKFFGRERFVLLILVSVIVRQNSELWILPGALRVFDHAFGTTFHLSRSVSSIGLVLVPLTANMFWKLDVRRGLLQVGVPTLLTWAILYFFLIPHTNLSFSRLELTYENVALDFLSSPKAYIVLVVGAYVASRYNLMFGWDYSGILVPALLAIACFSPLRLVTTAAEAAVLVGAVRLVTLLPGLRTMNLEGPRKVALVFTMSFLLKYLLGWLAGPWLGDLKVTDLFGFGYLVPSLIAVKMLQKEAIGRILVPAFAVGLLAFVLGSGVGFGLDQLAPPAEAATRASSEPLVATRALARSPVGTMALAHVRTRQGVSGDVPLTRPWRELERYTVLWRAIDGWLASSRAADQARGLAQVTRLARQSGLDLRPLAVPVGGRAAYALVETEERLGDEVGWDSAVLVPGARGPVIEAPRPASEAPAAEAAALLCEQVHCRAVLASGVDTHDAGLSAGDALAEARSPFAIAHRQLRSAHVLQVRADASLARGKAVLHVDERLPDLDLGSLWPALELSWQPPPGTNLEYGDGGTSVLRVHPDDLWLLLAARAPALPAPEPDVAVEAFLARVYGRGDAESPTAAEGVYTPPSQSELRFLETLVAAPLLGTGDAAALPIDARRRLAHHMASLVGYELRQLPDGAGAGVGAWLLAEREQPARLGWGVIAGRTGAGEPIAIEVPRPKLETGTWRLGTELWLASGAELLVIAGESLEPGDASEADEADPASGWNLVTPFQAFHEAAHTHLAAGADPMILQVRGFAATQPVHEPLVVTLGRPLLDAADAPRRLTGALAEHGPLGFLHGGARYYDGSLAMLELAGSGNAQLHYSTRLGTVACALLWFSERVREPFREADPVRERNRFAPFALPLATRSATSALTLPALGAPPAETSRTLATRYQALLGLASAYAAQENVQILRRLGSATTATPGAFVHAGYSPELGRPYLLVEVHEGAEVLRGLVLVPGNEGDERGLDAGATDLPGRVASALFQRPRTITVHGTQVER
jgi:hypothetical protein